MDNTIYTNSFSIVMGHLDAVLTFKLETPILNEDNYQLERVERTKIADIRMNPALAKELCIKLKEQIDMYEKMNGEIRSLSNSNE